MESCRLCFAPTPIKITFLWWSMTMFNTIIITVYIIMEQY